MQPTTGAIAPKLTWTFGDFIRSQMAKDGSRGEDLKRQGWISSCGTWAIDGRLGYDLNDDPVVRYHVTHRPTTHCSFETPVCGDAVRYCELMNSKGDFSKTFPTKKAARGDSWVTSQDPMYGVMAKAHVATKKELGEII